MRSRAVDQIVEILLRTAQRLAVSLFALAADIEIGIEALLQRQNFNLEFFFDQQAQRALGGFGAGGIGIKVHHDILAEAAQQFRLHLGKGRAGAGDDVVKSGGVNGNAIHLAFDQNGVIEFADSFFRLVKIEENSRLWNRSPVSGEFKYFGPGFFVGGESASR